MSSLTRFPVARGFICAAWVLLACASAGRALSQDQNSPPTTTSETARDPEIDADFRGFVIPDHTRFDRTLSLSAAGRSGVTHEYARHAPSSSSGGALAGSAAWMRDSDRLRLGVEMGLALSGDRSRQRSRLSYSLVQSDPDVYVTRSRDIGAEERASARFDCRYFPSGSSPWGGRLAISTSAADGQHWTSSLFSHELNGSPTSEERDRSELWTYRSSLTADFALGYGRVRDATGVFDARLLEERLAKDGRIVHPLSPSARRALAQLFYASSAYTAAHDLAEKAFWHDVERILIDDGALSSSGFDAYDLMHATERIVVATNRFIRESGFFVGPVLTVDHYYRLLRRSEWQRDRRWEQGSVTRDITTRNFERSWTGDDVLLAGIAAEWHKPAGRRLQLDGATTLRADLEGLRVERSWQSSFGAAYLLGERWFADFQIDHERRITDHHGQVSTWGAGLHASLAYYLEDRWHLALSGDTTHDRHFNRTYEFYGRETSFTLGLSYETGRADVPGIAPPIRPLN